jgi:hypothetical protein
VCHSVLLRQVQIQLGSSSDCLGSQTAAGQEEGNREENDAEETKSVANVGGVEQTNVLGVIFVRSRLVNN